ncbi:MAG: glycosyltransferase family 4 protein [Bryobacteraceae bacterium]|nr:glycosyltransferase family 4 protein [Bryobacteraceae bacterium]
MSKPLSAARPNCVALPYGPIAILTGGFDKPYAYGIAMALVAQGLDVEVIGSDEIDSPELHSTHGLRFLNLHGEWGSSVSRPRKLWRVAVFYARLIKYAALGRTKIFHILWNNKIPLFDRTLLMLIYRAFGKSVVLTAHNVNAGERDGTDSLLNRLSLKSQYRLVDHVFVHTNKMKQQLTAEYGVKPESVTVIPFGINNAVPHTGLGTAEARCRLGIAENEKTILFFGNIRVYKGLHLLVEAFELLVGADSGPHRLIIAGSKPNAEGEQYWKDIQRRIECSGLGAKIVQKIQYIPDDETEIYFKAADVAVLPYTYISQSGVLSLSYSFGLPVIVTNVGSFKEEVVEGKTGFICSAGSAAEVARAIQIYFESDLYNYLDDKREEIRSYATERFSWHVVGERTREVYARTLSGEPQ